MLPRTLAAACDPDTIRRLVAAARENRVLGAEYLECQRRLIAFGDSVGAKAAAALDVAWAEATAALPEGATLTVGSTRGVASGPYVAATDSGPPSRGFAYADTPAAALHALAEALRKPVTA